MGSGKLSVSPMVSKGFPAGSMVRNPRAVQETQETRAQSLSWEAPLEEEVSTSSSILDWNILWTEKPGGLLSTGSQRVRQDLVTEHAHTRCLKALR